MGITIHYSGRFNQKASLTEMVEEVAEIADINKWKYHIFNTNLPKEPGAGDLSELYGMTLNIPHCETLALCFLDDYKLVSPGWLHIIEQGSDDKEGYRYMPFTKTQFGGVEVHMRIIHLLKYLSVKYFEDFELRDEAEYWETGDEAKAKKIFTLLGNMINKLGAALNNIHSSPDDTIDDLANRINEKLKDFFDNEKINE